MAIKIKQIPRHFEENLARLLALLWVLAAGRHATSTHMSFLIQELPKVWCDPGPRAAPLSGLARQHRHLRWALR